MQVTTTPNLYIQKVIMVSVTEDQGNDSSILVLPKIT